MRDRGRVLVTFKRCADCGKRKAIYNFYKKAPCRYRSRCKPCYIAWNRTHKKRFDSRAPALNPEEKQSRKSARAAINMAVWRKRIQKPTTCQACGKFSKSRNLHGHHEKYSYRLRVEWLCQDCHFKKHLPLLPLSPGSGWYNSQLEPPKISGGPVAVGKPGGVNFSISGDRPGFLYIGGTNGTEVLADQQGSTTPVAFTRKTNGTSSRGSPQHRRRPQSPFHP